MTDKYVGLDEDKVQEYFDDIYNGDIDLRDSIFDKIKDLLFFWKKS